MLKLPTSLGCLLGTQPAVAGAGSLVELEISYPLDGAVSLPATSAGASLAELKHGWVDEMQNKAKVVQIM